MPPPVVFLGGQGGVSGLPVIVHLRLAAKQKAQLAEELGDEAGRHASLMGSSPPASLQGGPGDAPLAAGAPEGAKEG